jgi:hypothetical protein
MDILKLLERTQVINPRAEEMFDYITSIKES